MDNQANKASVPQIDIIGSDDYERGLRVLARIIARVHVRRITKKFEGRAEPFKGEPSP
jgi:hypothetical protein